MNFLLAIYIWPIFRLLIVIGCTNKPYAEGVDTKGLKDAFDEKICLSWPDYGSSLKMWRHAVAVGWDIG